MKIGYVRVSSKTQNIERQEVLMQNLGVEKIFIDVCSGKNTNRPQLMEMLRFAREGDMIVVESISRFARNTKDLLTLVDDLTAKKIEFVSKKESMDTSTPAGRLMLTMFGAISQLEREYLLDRQREGIELKKARGEYKGRTPIDVNKAQFKQEYDLWKSGQITARTAMNHLGIKSNTFYRRVKQYEEVKELEK